ncbi:MAG: divergent PAP2 family protein [Clostridia bacterium]|nr:divergent PAP2 family protein [Clostridia bacterium]
MFFDILKELIANYILTTPILAWLVSQLFKFTIHSIVERRLCLERLFGDGGLPSGHSATVTALACMCGWGCGFGSAMFAVATMVAIVVMHDAMGVRRETGKQAVSIKLIADTLNQLFLDEDSQIRTGKLKELVGHTPLQVVLGFLVGVIVAVSTILITGIEYASVLI